MQSKLQRLQFRFAKAPETNEIIRLFRKYSNATLASAPSPEFLCELGISASIKRNEMLIATYDNTIIGAARVYLRKKDNIYSIYQLVIDKPFRDPKVIENLLKLHAPATYEYCCNRFAAINLQLEKLEWKEIHTGAKTRTWAIKV